MAQDPISAAIAPENSAWVSANAGSGKTHLLANRVTRLLLSGVDPARILCLTYTKAAAAEMSSRLFARLGTWALLPDSELRAALAEVGATDVSDAALPPARVLFAKALETPGGLKIQTIHSFCQRVLARFPVEAGIPARFQILDERSGAELMKEARNIVLTRAHQRDRVLASAVDILATRAPDGRFADILDQAIRDRRRLRELIDAHDDLDGFIDHLRGTLGLARGEDEKTALTHYCAKLTQGREIIRNIVDWLSSGSKTDITHSAYLGKFLDEGGGIDAASHLASLFMTDKGPRLRLATASLQKSAPGNFDALMRWQSEFIAADSRRKSALTAKLTESIVTVAIAVLDEYAAAKRARAALDYDDLISHTLDLLDRKDAAAWVLYKLDHGLDHILVDEAQDTSPEQWEIVAKLSEEFFAGKGVRDTATRTVFAVGDEKQSIFSFQGAAPEEFGRNLALFRTRAQNAKLPFAEVRPLVSRRSTREVLRYVDEVFSTQAMRDGLSANDASVIHEAHRADNGRVEIWPAVKPPPRADNDPWTRPVDAPPQKGAHVELATRIAERIQNWLQEGIALPGTTQRIRPGDIMILVRRRNAFSDEMIRQLIDRRVPVAGADRMVLMDQIAVADLVALGRFALLPDDDLNLAALLKSPIIGFNEDDLFALAHGRERGLWRELLERSAERPIFTKAADILSNALARADFIPPFEFYARALAHGLRRKLVARLGNEAADAIDEFLALAIAHESAHPPSLESFLHWFQSGASEVKRDMEQSGGAVRVMTVHGAKGLEANIVFLPDTTQVPDHERRAGLLYTDDCVYFGIGKELETPPVIEAKDRVRAAEMREYRRLLYVALTRARDWLIICGYETAHGVRDEAWYKGLKEAAERIGQPETDGPPENLVLGLPLGKGDMTAARTIAPAEIALPPFLLAAPLANAAAPRILRPFDAAGMDEPGLLSPLKDSSKRFQRGLHVHALLASLPSIEPANRRNVAALYLAQNGVIGDDQESLIAETLAVIEHPNFTELFGEGSRAEMPISAPLPEIAADVQISGQIDRLAITASRVLIADFKTNRPPPESVAETPALYRVQMALYRAALQKIYPGRKVSCALVWTDGARLMELPDSLLDAEIVRLQASKQAQNIGE